MPIREPVLLVPGAFGQDLVYWNVMQYLLEKDGFHVYTVTFPRFTLADLRVSAQLLRERAREILDAEGAARLHLVAHSMGGLISRHYVKFLRGDRTVASLACLGTPHHGTWTVISAPLFKGPRQIIPGSPFLQQLNDPTRDHWGVPITNVWSRVDILVVPQESALLDLPGVTNHRLNYAGHWSMLVSPKVYRWVREGLDRTEEPRAASEREAGEKGTG